MKKNLLSILLACGLIAAPLAAQSTQSQGSQAQSSMQSAGSSAATAAKDAGSATKSGTMAATDKVTGKIDINTASKEELMKLKGIGEATSDKIIAGRPYNSKRDLLTRKIVSQSTYSQIGPKIVAHHTSNTPNSAASNTK